MAVSHVFTQGSANWTGTVTVFNSQASTTTAPATALVRPQDWNSAHNFYYSLVGNTVNATTASGTDVTLSAAGGFILGGSTGTLVMSVPVLSHWEPFPFFTGSANSSHQPASFWVNEVNLPAPVTVSNIYCILSFNIGPPTQTSGASTGSEGYSYSRGITVFKRVDFAANSTRLTSVTTASIGISASFGWSSTSQSFVVSWVTNTTGGTTSTNTTSNAANWSSIWTGNKLVPIPCVTSFSEGEYFFAWGHSSTTNTSQQNTTLMSVSAFYLQPQIITVKYMSAVASDAAAQAFGYGEGVASALTTNNSMAITNISQATRHWLYFNVSNASG